MTAIEIERSFLYVGAHLSSSSVPQAGQAIAEKNLKDLSAKYSSGKAYIFANELEQRYLSGSEFPFNCQVQVLRIGITSRILSIFYALFLPYKFAARFRLSLCLRLFFDVSLLKPEKMFFDYTAAAIYIPVVRFSMFVFGWRSKIQCFEHDVTYEALQRLARKKFYWFMHFEYLRQKVVENHLLSYCNVISVMSKRDREVLVRSGISAKIEVFDGYEIFSLPRPDSLIPVCDYSLAYFGAMDRMENIDAVCFFLKNYFRGVIEEYPSVHFYIIGSNPSDKLYLAAQYFPKNITITGFVDNPAAYLAGIKIGLAPLRYGAGVKIKVVQMLEEGMVVVATDVGAEGIEHDNLIVAQEDRYLEVILASMRAVYS